MECHQGPVATHKSTSSIILNLTAEDFDLETPKTGNKKELLAYIDTLPNKHAASWGKRAQKKGTSKYKGVSLRRRMGNWRSQIHLHDKTYSVGSYDNEKEAALAYDKAATIAFGEYARTNQMMFPEDFKELVV